MAKALQLARVCVQPPGVFVRQHPFHHGPGHNEKARHEVHCAATSAAATEAGNLVVAVGYEPRARWQHAYLQAALVVGVIGLPGLALLARDGLHARINQRPGFRVRLERHPQGGCGALARVVVWRGADAAGAEHRVARGEGTKRIYRTPEGMFAYIMSRKNGWIENRNQDLTN